MNVTQENHTVGSGFVMRRVTPNGNGGFSILTYGEGDSIKQIIPGAYGKAERYWTENSKLIRDRALKACSCN